MNPAGCSPPSTRPASWKLLLALSLVYLSWGTTYLAIREGVQTLPPGLFGGVRVLLAGGVLLGYLAVRGQLVLPTRRELAEIGLVGGLMFIGGNWLISLGMKEAAMTSSLAAVLVATTPLWLALLETAWPNGERLTGIGWAGVLLGLAGVALIESNELHNPWSALGHGGPLLVLGSSFAWSLGSVLQRHRRGRSPYLVNAAWQMVLGGGSMTVLAVLIGEGAALHLDQVTGRAVFAFFYLLVVGSLIGFVAFMWLLGNASAALAGTYAYVNPVVAVLIGWLVAEESISIPMIGGMVIILLGVALVRASSLRPSRDGESSLPLCQQATGLPQRKRSPAPIMTE